MEVEGSWPINIKERYKLKDLIDLVSNVEQSEITNSSIIIPNGRGRGKPAYNLSKLAIPMLQSDADRLNSKLGLPSTAGPKGRGRRIKCAVDTKLETQISGTEDIIGVERKIITKYKKDYPTLGTEKSTFSEPKPEDQVKEGQFEDAQPAFNHEPTINILSIKDLKKLQPRECFLLLKDLPCQAEEEDVYKMFTKHGEVLSLEMKHENTLALLQRAVVCMNSKKSCDKAFRAIRGTYFMESKRQISVEKLSETIRKEDDLRFHLFK